MNLRDQLQSVYDSYGKLTPVAVLDTARDPSHPLHSRFQWDDTVAAEAYRLDQAHRLIQSVKVVYKPATKRSGPKRVRGFIALPDVGGSGFRYEPSESVALDPLLREMALADMRREFQALKDRYGHFVEFVRMLEAEGVAA